MVVVHASPRAGALTPLLSINWYDNWFDKSNRLNSSGCSDTACNATNEVHEAARGSEKWRVERKWRGLQLTVGEMHASMLVREDGFGTIAGRGAAAQSARVTSSRSSPQGPTAGARLLRWRRVNRFTCGESLQYLFYYVGISFSGSVFRQSSGIFRQHRSFNVKSLLLILKIPRDAWNESNAIQVNTFKKIAVSVRVVQILPSLRIEGQIRLFANQIQLLDELESEVVSFFVILFVIILL